MRIKKGDQVKILSGKDKGKTAKVLEVDVKERKLIVEGVNLVTKHRKPRRSRERGQKILKPSPLESSNVLLVCSSCGKPTRIGINISDKGEKSRVCKHCHKSV